MKLEVRIHIILVEINSFLLGKLAGEYAEVGQ
jgi:hypothetical protein